MTHAPSARAGLSSNATGHAQAKYLPETEARKGVALCLSGGGFRASLFHLGALRRLNELGILSQIDTISSVSGGSILAAHVARRLDPWPDPEKIADDWEGRVARPFRDFANRNLRTLPILARALPWNWLRSSTGVEGLARLYKQRLTEVPLRALPARPRFVFCATDMTYGVNWTFTRDRVGDYQAGFAQPPDAWDVSRAVAASSCFPPVFNPMPMGLPPERLKGGKDHAHPQREARVKGMRLSDGGVYDNLGLESVWKDHACVLVSDGGATFDFKPDSGLANRLWRYTEIATEQGLAVRKRWLISNYLNRTLAGAYWGIGTPVARYELPDSRGYPEDLVTRLIAETRTDLDAFSKEEIAVLENHGYLLADAAARKHARHLVSAGADVELKPPHPEAMAPEFVETALASSHKRRLLGRW